MRPLVAWLAKGNYPHTRKGMRKEIDRLRLRLIDRTEERDELERLYARARLHVKAGQ